MKTTIVRRVSVALAAAVALIATQYAVAGYPSIVCSFRMSGTAVPYARGVYTGWYSTPGGIFYEGPGRHSFRVFTSGGSLVATYPMPGGVMLGDADQAPEGYSGCFAIVDEGSHELKAYTTTGSFHSVIRTLPSDVVAYACGGHVVDYLYLGTTDGKVFRYTPAWSFLNSFWTGVPTADLAAGCGYAGMWGDWVILGPSQAPAGLYAYTARGTFHSSFALPGIASRGALCVGGGTMMWCLRDLGTEIWAYQVDTGPLMAVEPASLGRIKALYK
ncbi:MAG: hypothetical protein V3W11_02440 [bacterium]